MCQGQQLPLEILGWVVFANYLHNFVTCVDVLLLIAQNTRLDHASTTDARTTIPECHHHKMGEAAEIEKRRKI